MPFVHFHFSLFRLGFLKKLQVYPWLQSRMYCKVIVSSVLVALFLLLTAEVEANGESTFTHFKKWKTNTLAKQPLVSCMGTPVLEDMESDRILHQNWRETPCRQEWLSDEWTTYSNDFLLDESWLSLLIWSTASFRVMNTLIWRNEVLITCKLMHNNRTTDVLTDNGIEETIPDPLNEWTS